MSHSSTTAVYSRALYVWACITVCTTIVLLTLGTLVTTLHVGMTDPIWPTEPWYLFIINWREPSPGFLLEHSHRLAGYVVGLLAIGLCVGSWLLQPRRSVAWLGTLCLLGVIIQGLLGGFRVLLDQWLGSNLALLHGLFAQVVLSLMVAAVHVTSPSWCKPRSHPENVPSRSMRYWAFALLFVVACQLFFGGLVRHFYSPMGQRLHVMNAFVVFGVGMWVFRLGADYKQVDRPLSRACSVLLCLLLFQVALGVEVWLQRFLGAGAGPIASAVLRTMHFLIGGMVLASSVVIVLLASRHMAWARVNSALRVPALEEVA